MSAHSCGTERIKRLLQMDVHWCCPPEGPRYPPDHVFKYFQDVKEVRVFYIFICCMFCEF